MRQLLNVNNASPITDVAILIARLGIGALMLVHGIPKMIMIFSGEPLQFPEVMGMSAELSLSLTVFSEVLCSVFIIAGFATRIASLPLIITMLVAVIVIHGADPFAKQEPALYYLLVYVVLLFAGSGRYSIDYFLRRKNERANYSGKRTRDRAFA